MSFFDDNRKIGFALIIVGLIGILGAIIAVITAFTDDGNLGAAAVTAVGSLIYGVLILFYGMNVRKSSNDKVAILSGLIRVIAIATILPALFYAVGDYLANNDIGIWGIIKAILVDLIVGVILLWIAGKVGGSNKNIASKLLWIILLVAFLVLSLWSIYLCVDGLLNTMWAAAVVALCNIFIYLYALFAVLSPEVKNSMSI